MPGEVFENIFSGELVIFESAAGLDAEKLFFATRSTRAHSRRHRRRAEEGPDLEDAAVAHLRHVINEHEHILRQHRIIGCFHDLMMQRFVVAVFDEPLHQLERFRGLIAGVHENLTVDHEPDRLGQLLRDTRHHAAAE